MQNNNVSYETLNQQIVEINGILNELKKLQTNEINILERNHAVNMKKFDKLQEYNKIADMTNQVFEKRLLVIENAIMQISKALSA